MPGDKSDSIPMGFKYEKEAVGEAPTVSEEYAPALKGGGGH